MNTLIVLTALVACAAAQYLAPHGYLGGHAAYGHHGLAAYSPLAGHHGYAGYPYAHHATTYAAAPHAYAAAPVAYAAHHAAPYAHHAPAHHVPTYASQYHSQDEYGQASYGYAQPGAAKSEVRDAYGNVAGSYYYINPEGKRVEVSYTAGVNGFQVHSNDLPVAPVADLVQAPAPVYTGVAPEPVQDTPEVAAAKAAHLEALAAAEHRRKRSVHLGHHGLHGFGYSFAAPAYAHHAIAAPAHVGYAAPAHLGYAAPAHLGYATPAHVGYAAPAHHATYAAPAVVGREATLTTVVLNPGHAEAYRVD